MSSIAKTERGDINRIPSIVAIVFICTLPALVIVLLPMLVGGLVISLGFTEQQGGYVLTADMVGYTLGTIGAFFFIHRVNWRTITLSCLILMVLVNLASGWVSEMEPLLLLRMLSGMGGGIITAVTFAAMGQLRDPDSAYGLWLVFQAILGGAGSISLPHIIARWDIGAGFIIFAMLLVTGCLLYRFVPLQVLGTNHSSRAMERNVVKPTSLGILGILVIYIGLMSVYTYLERIGVSSGLAQTDVGICFLAMTVAGLAGGTAAAKFSVTFGRVWPVLIGVLGVVCSFVVLMSGDLGFYLYMFACALYFGMWSFLLPYLVGALAAVDTSGRALALGNAAIGGGLALGPFTATFLLGDNQYNVLILFGIGLVMLSYILLLPLLSVSQAGLTQKLGSRTA